jgi:alpha-beta hydrolase superfamily lysophospholipase
MRHTQDWLISRHGLDLYYQSWQPSGDAKAMVAMVHGLGSHSGWFMTLVHPLVDSGYGVYAFDLRGHGRSAGQRGHIDSWAQYRDDFQLFQQLMQSQQPTLPCFGLGHSLGGIIVLDYALRHPETLSGLIAIAPAVGEVSVSAVKLSLGRLLSWSWPHFSLDTGLKRQGGSRDLAILNAYAHDPLRHTRGTARLATEFLKTRQWISDRLPQLTVPILMLHGSDDPIVSLDSGRHVFDQIQAVDKEYREYPHGYHDLHNDSCASLVVRDILYWLDRQTLRDRRFCQFNFPANSTIVSTATA